MSSATPATPAQPQAQPQAQAQAQAEFGVTGLGVMGRNLARNFARHGFATALHNRTTSRTDDVMQHFGHEGTFVPSRSAEEFVRSLERPRRIVIMVNAGPATDAVIDEFAPLLEPGDMLIDGGNAHFKDTRRRERTAGQQAPLRRHGRLRRGGGRAQRPVDHARRIRTGLPRPRSHARDCRGSGRRHAVLHARRPGRSGPLREDGAQRHRVRRHAAHRRGLRPAAERGGVQPQQIAEIFRTWNEGRLDSDLIQITAEDLAHIYADNGKPFGDIGLNQAEQRAPAAGPCRMPWTWASRSTASRRRCSPGRCPGTPTCAAPPASWPA